MIIPAGILPAAPDETTTAHMAVTFTEPDEPSSSSSGSADDDGADSAEGDGSDTDSGSDSGYEEDPRYAAAEVDCHPTQFNKTPHA